jgi:hypothetical protein
MTKSHNLIQNPLMHFIKGYSKVSHISSLPILQCHIKLRQTYDMYSLLGFSLLEILLSMLLSINNKLQYGQTSAKSAQQGATLISRNNVTVQSYAT